MHIPLRTMRIDNGQSTTTALGDIANQGIYINVAINVPVLYARGCFGTVFL